MKSTSFGRTTATLSSTAGSPSGLLTRPAQTSIVCACRRIATWLCTPSVTNPSGTPIQPTSVATCVASIWPTKASWWFTERPSRSGAPTMPVPAPEGPRTWGWWWEGCGIFPSERLEFILNPCALKTGNKRLTVHSWLLSWCFLSCFLFYHFVFFVFCSGMLEMK